MQRLWITCVLLLTLCSVAWGANTHGMPSEALERQAWFGDALAGYAVSGCLHGVPGSGLTTTTAACNAYVKASGGELVYVTQPTKTVGPLTDATTNWIAIHRDISTAVGGWTRQSGTHYLWRASATYPGNPTNGLIIASVTTSGGNITAVTDYRLPRSYVKHGRFDITDPLYGAVAGTDSTTAIQAAVSAAQGRTVFFPASATDNDTTRAYIVTAEITDLETTDTKEGTKLVGEGMYRSLIDNRVASGYAFRLGSATSSVFARHGHVKQLGIITSTSPASSGGVFIRASYQFLFEDVRVQGLTGDGLHQSLTLGDADGSVLVEYRRCWIQSNGGIGINITATASTKVENSFVLAEHNFITGNTGGGMNWIGLAADIRNNAFTLNRGFGGFRAYYNGANNRVLRMSGNDFEHDAPQGVEIQSAVLAVLENNECIQHNSFTTATSCFLFGGTAVATVESVRFINSFIRVTGLTPHTAFNGGAQANSTTIENTHWSTYDAGGQSRFSTALLQTLSGTRIYDKNVSTGQVAPYPEGQHTLNTTISGSGETYTPDATIYGVHNIDMTVAGTLTIAAPTISTLRNGTLITFIIKNSSGGVITLTWNGTYINNGGWRDPADTGSCTVTFMRHSSHGWQRIASSCTNPTTTPAAQTIAAGNTVDMTNVCPFGLKRITAAGPVTTDTTNTFTAPAAANAGCIVHVCNVGGQTITLDNNANFLSAGTADVTLTGNDCVSVGSSGVLWYQLAPMSSN